MFLKAIVLGLVPFKISKAIDPDSIPISFSLTPNAIVAPSITEPSSEAISLNHF